MSTAVAAKPVLAASPTPRRAPTLAKVGHTDARWFIVDATGLTSWPSGLRRGQPCGPMGKHKPIYTANVDTGDFVVILNAGKVKVSGRKAEQRSYDKYTYYPGGHKVVSHRDFQANHPAALLKHSVRRMLPKSKLGEQMLGKLKVYKGDSHPHAAQRPEAWKPVI